MNNLNNPILQVEHVSHFFKKGKNLQHAVLEDFNLQLFPGEIVGMLGRSGSGKSTLLRIIAGLIVPSTGEVLYKSQPLTEQQTPSLAMIFQNFALLPWMTVLENVELGLLAKHLPRKEIKKRALSGIDLIGLDGYEQAYPRELSGGMQQRVGFARAIVTHPDILLMDEPFSALDVLTAETLRNDFIELWLNRTLPIQSAILVTHNIEESVLMCDRLLIFSTNPGRIISEISVNLPHPRDRNSSSFKQVVEEIYLEMTEHLTSKRFHLPPPKGVPINTVLPLISSNIFSGFLETLSEPPYNGRADLSILSSSLHMEIDDIFPIAESLQAIDLALITQGDVQLTPSGLLFVESDTDQRKKIFAEKLIQHVALARLIVDSLNENNNHAISKKHFLDILRQYMTEKAALRSLQAIITWGRYGEIFAYHDSSETFSLENPN